MRSLARRVPALAAAALALLASPRPLTAAAETADAAAARAVFEKNLDAIRRRDRAAYLACYLEAPSLARTGPAGPSLGYEDFEKQAGEKWPDLFEASDLRLMPLRPGLVYGTYRYRVLYGVEEHSGLSERLFLRTGTQWKIAMTSAFDAPPGTPPPPRALKGATLLDGIGGPPIANAVVLLRDGKIECAGPRGRCAVPAGVDTLDCRGLWITPGLIDAHVHYSQTGWADGRPDALDLRALYPYDEAERRLRAEPERFHRTYLCCGVTSVFDVGGYPWTLAAAARTRDDLEAPRMIAAGPLLSTLDHWLNLPAERQFIYLADSAAARTGVHYLASIGAAAVKVWFIIAPGRDFDTMARLVAYAGEEARRAHLPLIVHATGLKEAKAALRAGANLLVHSVWDLPVDEEFLRLARRNHTIYCPTLTVIGGYFRLTESVRSGRAPDVDDPCGCVDSLTLAHVAGTPETARAAGLTMPPRTGLAARESTMAANLVRVSRAGIPIAMGTDAGNPLTLHGASVFGEMEAMQRAGLTPMQVLVAATRGGALAMGRLAETGTVEAGKAADLVILGADPTADIAHLRDLRFVVRGGEVRPQAELRARAPGR